MTMTFVPTALTSAPFAVSMDFKNTWENSSMLSCLSPSASNSAKKFSNEALESSRIAPLHKPRRSANASSRRSAKMSSGLDTRPSWFLSILANKSPMSRSIARFVS